ncbi:MAG: phenylacetate--CoA ligase family protein, partial [Nitrospira sp.]|nr:phenylacetate--CoA ligase family protein [Nitrospira sp.]
MKEKLLKLYHRLPVPARSVAASLHGYYLRSWRYSTETDHLVSEALDREKWSSERWRLWQEERLAYVLHRAATQVPYYCEQWSARRRKGDRASWEYLENWPILEKNSVRENASAFVSDDCKIQDMYREQTSGTSGSSLSLWWSLKTVRAWYALFEARWRGWNGVSRHERWANIGGQLVSPVYQNRPPFWVWNKASNQLYMSSYHLAPHLIPFYLDALVRYGIKYLWGYSSSLYALAREVERCGRTDLPMHVVITNAEPLFDYQRETISKAFQCPVRETYGMAEIVAAASECGAGRLHLWPEVGLVEVFEENEPVAPGVPGDLVCTGLLNEDMPLIRYRVGDRGVLQVQPVSCSCGRALPILASVEGRISDVLYTIDGKQIGRLGRIFQDDLHIHEAQIIQEKLDQIRICFVPTPGFTLEDGRTLVDLLRARMGKVEVILEKVPEVP